MNSAWQRLKQLALLRQEKLFGAHEIQRFNRDADETIAWILEKDSLLSTEDVGRDLVSVTTLQRKHDALERDLAALAEKVRVAKRQMFELGEMGTVGSGVKRENRTNAHSYEGCWVTKC